MYVINNIKKICCALLTVLWCGLCSAQVFVYSALDENTAHTLFEAFEQETGIEVKRVSFYPSDAIVRLESEKARPLAHIFIGGLESDHIEAKKKGLTVPYASPHATQIPSRFIDADYYWTAVCINPLVFATDALLARALDIVPPKSWADLLKDSYHSRLAMTDPVAAQSGYAVIDTMRTLCNFDEEKLFTYLHALDKHISLYEQSDTTLYKNAASGSYPITIGFASDILRANTGKRRLTLTAPFEGTTCKITAMSLIKGIKDNTQAKRLHDWMLSKTAQDILAATYNVPLLPVSSPHKDMLSIHQIKTIPYYEFWGDTQVQRVRLLTRWNREIAAKR